MSEGNPRELYQQAIAELEAVSADFTVDDAVRGEANSKISELRVKAEGAALDDLTSRTAHLEDLSANLSSILQRTQGSTFPALDALVAKVQKAISA